MRVLFDAWEGPALNVFLAFPDVLAADRPVVFVMHGVNRNADEYRDQWHDLAVQHDFLLVVPEFSQRDFPGSQSYNLGNVRNADGEPNPVTMWSYSAIEPIFDQLRERLGMSTGRYALYGHSAGAQYVHRFIFHVPDARVSRIISANAGWYMAPDFEVDYPYGLNGSVVSQGMLKAALSLPVTILLGEQDTDTADPNLRKKPEAMTQGAHRLDRGRYFFQAAQFRARELAVPFEWQLVLVPGAGHDNRQMAPAALPFLLQGADQ